MYYDIAGKQYAALVMVADLLKGTIPVLIAKALEADPVTIGFTALAAVIGHMYPVFFDFKGGKGVATAIGALLRFSLYCWSYGFSNLVISGKIHAVTPL